MLKNVQEEKHLKKEKFHWVKMGGGETHRDQTASQQTLPIHEINMEKGRKPVSQCRCEVTRNKRQFRQGRKKTVT